MHSFNTTNVIFIVLVDLKDLLKIVNIDIKSLYLLACKTDGNKNRLAEMISIEF